MEKDKALDTLARVFHYGEERECEDGAVMFVGMDLWNEGCEAIEALIDSDPNRRTQKVDLKIFAEWLHEMQELTGGCVLAMRAEGRAGMVLELSWEQDGQAMSYSHPMSGTELCQMPVFVEIQVLQQIRWRVENSKPVPPTKQGEK